MYERGKLKIVRPFCETADEDGECDYYGDDEHVHSVYDSAVPDSHPQKKRFSPAVYLPHSCGDWVIGGEDEIRALIQDLNAVLIEVSGIAVGDVIITRELGPQSAGPVGLPYPIELNPKTNSDE